MIPRTLLLSAVMTGLASPAYACDLCAISSANSAKGETLSGFSFTLSEQFIPYRTEYIEGEEVKIDYGSKGPDYLDKSITHLVPTWNFSDRFGVSLNVPLIHESYRRYNILFDEFPPKQVTEKGNEFGLGDISLIGRVTVFRRTEMEWGVSVTALGGVKFPTGDTSFLEDEAEQTLAYNKFFGFSPNHAHNIVTSGVHLSDLSLGSGSFDGIFGLQAITRWNRWFLNVLAQYYLRTEGESTYHYGDEVMINGGPGAYLLLAKRHTLSLQAYAGYESRGRDELFGTKAPNTGLSACYLGPQVTFTWGLHFSAQAAVDLPFWITNNGWQNVPHYRIHGGLTWRF
jgi:hypothetical protein